MAQESCNLDKEEAEILKPSPSSSAHKDEASEILKPSPSSSLPTPPMSMNSVEKFSAEKPKKKKLEGSVEGQREPKPSVGSISRCSSCRKKVGLTSFRCRCGDLFCSQHRYSDTHDCSFDYKAFGREQISKANPLVRAAKIIRI